MKKTSEQVLIDDLVAARRWHDQHQRELRSKNSRVRARARRLESNLQRLDREITAVLAQGRRTSR